MFGRRDEIEIEGGLMIGLPLKGHGQKIARVDDFAGVVVAPQDITVAEGNGGRIKIGLLIKIHAGRADGFGLRVKHAANDGDDDECESDGQGTQAKTFGTLGNGRDK